MNPFSLWDIIGRWVEKHSRREVSKHAEGRALKSSQMRSAAERRKQARKAADRSRKINRKRRA